MGERIIIAAAHRRGDRIIVAVRHHSRRVIVPKSVPS